MRKRTRLRRVRATVDGDKASVAVRRGVVRVSLAGAQGRVTVRIKARTRSGRRISVKRRVEICRAATG